MMLERANSISGRTGAENAARIQRRNAIELCVGYALIMATIWTPRPAQHWLYGSALAWVLVSTWASFPGWTAMGFGVRGVRGSLWIVGVALLLAAAAVSVAHTLHTLHEPHTARGWIKAFGGYSIWAFTQQFLLQGYFLLRFLRLLTNPRWAVVAAASLFALAHLPNPILTPVTLLWGLCACFIFVRWRTLYPLAIAHALFGICIAVTLPPAVMHNMRVGWGYLMYRAPALHAIQNSNAPAARVNSR
jgi:membrane protease YdiL (CAAX protease family)